MLSLICPVRRCGRALERASRALRCAAGHSFDIARSGYCNLLQPQDRRSPVPGDGAEAVAARSRWLEAGHAETLVAALEDLVGEMDLAPGSVLLDVGCGDGHFAWRLAAQRPWEVCGIDLSVAALRRAAKRFPRATWIVANADRQLPLAGGSVDLVVSLFGRRPAAELHRVLAPPRRLIVAVPAEDDAIELRRAVLGQGRRIDRVSAVLDALASRFELVERRTVRERVRLGAAALADLLALTYRGARRAESERAAMLRALEVTLSAELLLLAPGEKPTAASEKGRGRRPIQPSARDVPRGATADQRRHVRQDPRQGHPAR